MGTERCLRNPRLYGIGTDHRNEVTVVHPPTFTVGRAPDCSLVISHFEVSLLHCCFKFDETTWTLTDHSFGGTYVNGKKVSDGVAVVLEEGYVVKLGPHPNFVYIFSFRGREDLEPVLSRLSLRMQGDEDCKIIGTVPASVAKGSRIAMNRPRLVVLNSTLYAEGNSNVGSTNAVRTGESQDGSLMLRKRVWSQSHNIPQETTHSSHNFNGMYDPSYDQEFIAHSDNSSGSSSPSSLHSSTRLHHSFEDHSSSNPVHDLNQTHDTSYDRKVQPSGSSLPSSPSSKYSSKRMRHSYVSPHMESYSGNQCNVEHCINHGAGTSNETNLKNQILELQRKLIASETKATFLTKFHQELQSRMGDNLVKHERKCQNNCKEKSKSVRQVSQDSEPNGSLENRNAQCISSSHTFSTSLVNVNVNVRYEPDTPDPELDKVKSELRRMQRKYVDLEKLYREAKHINNSLVIELQNKDESLKGLKKELRDADETKTSLDLCMRNYEDKLQNLYSVIESDLQCSICNEIFICPIILNCRHTFCEFCIIEWKKKKRDCPMCRAPIRSESRSIAVENFIDRIVETKGDMKDHHLNVILQRRAVESGRNPELYEPAELDESDLELDQQIILWFHRATANQAPPDLI